MRDSFLHATVLTPCRLLHLQTEVYQAKLTLFRPHLSDLLVSPDAHDQARHILLKFSLQAVGLHQRLRVVTPLHHVMSFPMVEL